MSLSVEELLKPRYKVIANDTTESFQSGELLEHPANWRDYIWKTTSGKIIFHPDNYPHLFQPLPWWSDRKPEELPEFVKIIERPTFVDLNPNDIVKIHKHYTNSNDEYNSKGCQVFGGDFMSYSRCVPSTEEEYLAYINQKQQ